MKTILYLLFIVSCSACAQVSKMPPHTQQYLQDALDLMQQRSVYKHTIDWKTFRQRVMEKAGSAKTIAETYPAITFAIAQLNDRHSYFRPQTFEPNQEEDKVLPVLADAATPGDIGYIRLAFCIGNEQELNAYISSVQTKIKQQAMLQPKGWIIDLRGNFGGNMWPMLLAVESLLGKGTMGYFVNAEHQYQPWQLLNGKTYIGDTLIYENTAFEALDLSGQYVAVLTDQATASSGEAMAIAFRNRPKTRSFGTATFGVSTGCVSHQLSDGSVINLAESVFADRTRTAYGLRVLPDVTTKAEDALEQGIAWIYSMH